MRHGDISSRTAPRLVFVWEHLLAHLPTERRRDWDKIMRRQRKHGKTSEALALWVTDTTMMAQVWRTHWNHDYGLDVITYLPEPFEEPLRQRLDAERTPFGNVTATTPERFAYEANTPGIARVFDVEPERSWVYGSKGRFVPDPIVFDPTA